MLYDIPDRYKNTYDIGSWVAVIRGCVSFYWSAEVGECAGRQNIGRIRSAKRKINERLTGSHRRLGLSVVSRFSRMQPRCPRGLVSPYTPYPLQYTVRQWHKVYAVCVQRKVCSRGTAFTVYPRASRLRYTVLVTIGRCERGIYAGFYTVLYYSHVHICLVSVSVQWIHVKRYTFTNYVQHMYKI